MRQISYLNGSPPTTHLLFGMIRRLAAWRPKHVLRAMLLIAFAALLSAPCVHAEITVTGDVKPDDPSTYDTRSRVYVGNTADGSVTLDDGSTVSVLFTYLGYEAGGAGTLTLHGEGTSWTSGRTKWIGHTGTGTLNITNGASVSNTYGIIGRDSGARGTVIVDGEGSTWTNSDLYVGQDGTGTLSISDGGTVTATSASINSASILTTDLGTGSSLAVSGGTGTITNDGTIRLAAGAGTTSGTDSPISAGIWSGTGTVQALGGVWDSTNHTVTVYDAATGTAKEAKTIDLFATQRILIADEATGQRVGASFMAATESTELTFTAGVMESSELSLLETSLGSGEEILVGWDFLAGDGYTDGDPVYLSLEIGSGYDLSDLAIWLFDESTWSEFLASDLAYDNTYASFTVTDFSGYAVTGTSSVPIPGAVWLLGSGLLGLIGIRRRK